MWIYATTFITPFSLIQQDQHDIFNKKYQLFIQGAPGSSLKMGIAETCERIKEEFNFIQNQYHT